MPLLLAVLLFMFFFNKMMFGLFLSILICYMLVFVSTTNFISDPSSMKLGEDFDFECGFEPFYKKGFGFSVQFFVIGLSFMLFDLEICLFLPVPLSLLGGMHFISIGVSFLVLVLFIYLVEINMGVFNR